MKRRLMTQTNLSSESGRSMVEILGVLAIVGVLSIGGIAGYRAALNRYRANEIFDGITKRMIVAKAQNLSGQPINLSEFPDTIEGLSYHYWCWNSVCGSGCGMIVYDMDKELCAPITNLAASDTQFEIRLGCGGVMATEFDCTEWDTTRDRVMSVMSWDK